ncbi:MAG: glycosyltransferase family 39 protein [Clostridiales bacterium]|nr:glycosyltransferase family 39 protein [Clostridiales bacterium]
MNEVESGVFASIGVIFALILILYESSSKLPMFIVKTSITAILCGLLLAVLRHFAGTLIYYVGTVTMIPAIMLFVLLFCKYKNNLDSRRITASVLIFIVWTCICYMLYISYVSRSIDTGLFLGQTGHYNDGHSGYIKYIVDNNWIPNVDIRGLGQFYHPPLHHLICAYFLKLYWTLFPSFGDNVEVLKFVTFYSAMATVFSFYRILKLWNISRDRIVILLLFFAFNPHVITSCANINNDALSSMFIFVGMEKAFSWYKTQSIKDIVKVSLAVGLGMMTKLSVGILAFPIGFIFLSALFSSQRSFRASIKKLFPQFLVFAAICVPLALWFQIRNYVKFGIPINYLFGAGKDDYIESLNIGERLFRLPNEFSIYSGKDSINNANIIIQSFKTFLFSSFTYKEAEIINIVGSTAFALSVLLAVVSVFSVIYTLVRNIRKKHMVTETTSIIILAIVLLAGYVYYCMFFPYIWTMHYRYIAQILITAGISTGIMLDDLAGVNGKRGLAIKALTLFVATVWTLNIFILFVTLSFVYII